MNAFNDYDDREHAPSELVFGGTVSYEQPLTQEQLRLHEKFLREQRNRPLEDNDGYGFFGG